VCAPADYARGQQLIRDARSAATISTVLVIAGTLAVAGGVVVWVTAPTPHGSELSIGVVPVLDATHAGFAAMGHF
jgi:hypothetical protein